MQPTPITASVPRGRPRVRLHDRHYGYVFIAPAFVLLVAVLGFPAVAAVLQSVGLFGSKHLSFTFQYYIQLGHDPVYLKAFTNTVRFVVFTVALHVILGLSIALLLNMKIPLQRFFRVIAILPWTMPDVIAGLVWRFMFDTLPGMINGILTRAGLITEPIDWLGTIGLVFPVVVFTETWRGFPYVMIILLAGLQAIPQEQYEAASIDGAGVVQRFWYVTLPNLRHVFPIALVLDTVWEARLFGIIYSMTGGGPGVETEVLSLLTYKNYFNYFNEQYAAAIAVSLAVILFFVSLSYVRRTVRQEG